MITSHRITSTCAHKHSPSPAAPMQDNEAQVKKEKEKRKSKSAMTHWLWSFPGVSVYLMTVFPLLLYTVCHHCLQCIDFPSNRGSFMPVGGRVTTYFRRSMLLLKPI